MRLLKLKIRNFRGFGSAVVEISLEGDLLLFYGPNGFGKTSLAEAIEWLFYGTTKRRLYGENYSRSEYANSFANIHGGTPCEVTATVNLDGREYELTRRLTQNEGSETFIDGRSAAFSSINLNPLEAVYPVVAQHGLQTFVHSKPKDRRDAICAALGLDELTALKNALDSARSSFQRSPPSAVASGRTELSANASVLAEIPATQDLARRWRLSPLALDYAADIEALLNAATSLTGTQCGTIQIALEKLRERRQLASRSVFDADKFIPDDTVIPAIATTFEAVVSALTKVEQAIADLVAATAAAYSTAILELWKRGLELSPVDDQCPMCEEDTLTAAKRADLARRLNDNAASLAKSAALASAITTAKAKIIELGMHLDEFEGAEPSASEAEQLSRLFGDGNADLASFNDRARAFAILKNAIREKRDAAISGVRKTPPRS